MANLTKIRAGRNHVYTRLLTAGQWGTTYMAEMVGGDSGEGFMACSALAQDDNGDTMSEGVYDSTTSTHAEMAALSAIVTANGDIDDIAVLTISSPPCRCCAFVLFLLGALDHVVTTRSIYKNPPGGSWRWPDNLRDRALFDNLRWQQIRAGFAGSGLTDDQIVGHMVEVVTNQAT